MLGAGAGSRNRNQSRLRLDRLRNTDQVLMEHILGFELLICCSCSQRSSTSPGKNAVAV